MPLSQFFIIRVLPKYHHYIVCARIIQYYSPVSVAVSIPGVPPPNVVHDGKLYQSGKHEGGAGSNPDVQGLSEDLSSFSLSTKQCYIS